MIVVTGGEGFIGKNLIDSLKRTGFENIVSLDTKSASLDSIYTWLLDNAKDIECVFHLGAITDTTETNLNLFDEYNLGASIFIWNLCTEFHIPLIYASSAATYGNGSEGFDDRKSITTLTPMNPYGHSKHQFDLFALEQEKTPPFWYGLKFFNVYGYGEEHKGKMASVVLHFYNQIKEKGYIKLFKSHRAWIADGEQKRDFVYVDDVTSVCVWLYLTHRLSQDGFHSGIYNVGTGKARSYNDLAAAVFKSLGLEKKITYIDTPLNIRNNYQYFTEAKMFKLRGIGCDLTFNTLEEGIVKYINKLKYENC